MREIGLDAKVTLSTLAPTGKAAGPAAQVDFSAVLKQALDGVNATQVKADELARAFQMGEPNVGLEDTMVAIATANVSFQTLVQVRNRLVSAYHDVMNMQV